MKMMHKNALTIVFAAISLIAAPLAAQEIVAAEQVESTSGEAEPMSYVDQWRADPTTVFESIDIDIAEFRFIARPIIVFADSPADPLFIEQMSLLQDRSTDLQVRDVVLIVDTDPDARSLVRQELRPRGFAIVLIGKDGRVAQRKPSPTNVRELGRAIDKMPLRIQEIREGNG